MKAWHFVGSRLRDGRPVPADGEVLRHNGPVEMCTSGLHASRRIIDALRYAPGPVVCRVECSEIVDEEDDKFVCRERTILWRVDAEDLLRDFARRCALDVIDQWDAPAVVREYLTTDDEALRVAAWAAAWGPGRANEAARAAAWAASGFVAWVAAWDAARGQHNRRLTAMVIARKP
jgi:hypothetical protein